jgi:flagellar biosynthesis/type III secretory pathway M-ring protein FliF/YscJ
LLLDHDVSWTGEGAAAKRALTAPSPEKIKAVRELVAGLIGLNTDRGDQIVVEALPFDSTLRIATPEPAPSPQPTAPTFNLPLQIPQERLIIIGAVAGGLILLLGVSAAVLMRKRRRKKAGKVEITPALGAAPEGKALVDAEKHIQDQIEDHLAQSNLAQSDILSRLKLPVPQTKKSEVLRGHLCGVVEKDAVVPAQVLRRWINEM